MIRLGIVAKLIACPQKKTLPPGMSGGKVKSIQNCQNHHSADVHALRRTRLRRDTLAPRTPSPNRPSVAVIGSGTAWNS